MSARLTGIYEGSYYQMISGITALFYLKVILLINEMDGAILFISLSHFFNINHIIYRREGSDVCCSAGHY